MVQVMKNGSVDDVSCSQTHPNVDKKMFTAESLIGLKNPEKSFPLHNDVGVLKWRLQTTEESLIPLTSKCRHGCTSETACRPTGKAMLSCCISGKLLVTNAVAMFDLQ